MAHVANKLFYANVLEPPIQNVAASLENQLDVVLMCGSGPSKIWPKSATFGAETSNVSHIDTKLAAG